MDGSNTILLAQKKKNKGKAEEKRQGSKSRKNKLAPPSKADLKKLKKLQEKKEKKLLQIITIKMLEKHKILDSAHSLLQSSATIGQTETFHDKRRRVVQLAKAGLEVPEDIYPLKKKRKRDKSSENEVILNLHASDYAQSGSSDLDGAKQMEVEDCKQSQSTEITVSKKSKSSEEVNVEPKEFIPSSKLVDKAINTIIDSNQNIAPSSSCRYYERNNKKVEDQPESNSNVGGMKISLNNTIKACVNVPTVVHVSRPKEVEKTRGDLPIIMMEQEIMEAINENPIILICGETGCGKTTQVPQFLYEAGYGSKICSEMSGIIGVTQPRRVAVHSSAKRVSFELGLRLGNEVGYQVRYDKRIGDNCSIKFMTDGILLREVQNDFLLRRYSVIILDEAHERSVNTDILVGMLSMVIERRQDLYLRQQKEIRLGESIGPQDIITRLKLIVMSATLRVEDFRSNRKLFPETPPIIEVPVRQFGVAIHFSKKTQEDYLAQAYKKVLSIHRKLPPGGILVFVTGQREVELLCKQLCKASNEFIADKAKRETDNETNPNLDKDMKDVTEAFETTDSSLDQQTDKFSSFDEDFLEMDFDTHESESESDFDDDNEEESNFEERADLAIDLSSLSDSFEALAGNTCNGKSEARPYLHLQTEKAPPGPMHVLPLYAMLPASSQLRVFENVPEGERLVVIATNVAETSLTIPGITYVVDTGKEKVKHYNFVNGMGTYEVQWISKASAAQRAGRAGRTGPGHCYRLYSSAAFSKDDLFLEFSKPEISEIPLDGVVLLIKSMGLESLDKVADFPFPTPPEAKALMEAEHCLKSLEALDDDGKLTPMGRTMAYYPMSPRHSRMLLTLIQIMRNQHNYPRANLVLAYAIATASALSFPNPFNMQFDGNQEHEVLKNKLEREAKARVRETCAKFNNPSSDGLSIAYALQLFELAENKFSFCQNHFLHLKTMEEMSKLREQLLQLVFHQSKFSDEFGWNHGIAKEIELSWRVSSTKHPLLMNEEDLLGQAICAGWADRVAKRIRNNDKKTYAVCYQSCALDETIYLHCWSSVSRSAPEFLVYSELLQTNRPYMHGVTSVKPEWLVKYASNLCSFSPPLSDPKPYYEPLNDQVMCWVSPSFGPHNWQLPRHSHPIENDTLRVSVFANALLEGNVLPCLKTVQKFLAMSPSSVLRPEALGQRRVGQLLNGLKMKSRIIDCRAMLREAWRENSRSLYSVIKSWFQGKFHEHFGELWEQMHSEVVLDGHELFARKVKDRKRMKRK